MTEPTAQPPMVPSPAGTRRVSLLAATVLAVTLLLCGGGATTAYLLVESTAPQGTAQPAAAVEGFLTAVFTKKSAFDAAEFVCPRTRDIDELEQLIEQVKAFERQFNAPRTSWEYPPLQPSRGRASATVRLTLTTANFQVATKQVRLVLGDDRGWWVCDIEPID